MRCFLICYCTISDLTNRGFPHFRIWYSAYLTDQASGFLELSWPVAIVIYRSLAPLATPDNSFFFNKIFLQILIHITTYLMNFKNRKKKWLNFINLSDLNWLIRNFLAGQKWSLGITIPESKKLSDFQPSEMSSSNGI